MENKNSIGTSIESGIISGLIAISFHIKGEASGEDEGDRAGRASTKPHPEGALERLSRHFDDGSDHDTDAVWVDRNSTYGKKKVSAKLKTNGHPNENRGGGNEPRKRTTGECPRVADAQVAYANVVTTPIAAMKLKLQTLHVREYLSVSTDTRPPHTTFGSHHVFSLPCADDPD
ncbi:hypothetical protein EVAR_11372_1 [Eumeta japonica]|uniref:Uncharacterized protein n=1 Tax=Eumeta variegata TaxID=151549 RepID=A0A4C1U103_EUMVA|nr:hypothetical protein EVAR_11372_1 [Eumeta japonica]